MEVLGDSQPGLSGMVGRAIGQPCDYHCVWGRKIQRVGDHSILFLDQC